MRIKAAIECSMCIFNKNKKQWNGANKGASQLREKKEHVGTMKLLFYMM